jgi:hypothetical protein
MPMKGCQMSIPAPSSIFNKFAGRTVLLGCLAGVSGCGPAPVISMAPEAFQHDVAAQYQALVEAGITAYDNEELARAHDYFAQACDLPAKRHHACLISLEVALELEHTADAIKALTVLAERWPHALAELDHEVIDFLWSSMEEHESDSAYHLLDALWRADWTIFGSLRPEYFWKELALMHADRGNADAAREIVATLAIPHVVILVRADRRFDELGPVPSSELPWNRLVDDYLAQLYMIAEEQPTRLAPLLELIIELIAVLRYHDALAIAVAVKSEVDRLAAAGEKPPFSDMDLYYNWILDNGARAMASLGLWEEALALQQEASRIPEDGQANVSQAIHLAGFHVAMGQPREALAVIEPLEDLASYGRMQVEFVRLVAALDLHDEPESLRALGYLGEHMDDAPMTAVTAFLVANRMDDAAATLVTGLADAGHRPALLDQLQDYARPAALPRVQLWRDRLAVLLARDDVQSAIRAVGRIESYDYCALRCLY